MPAGARRSFGRACDLEDVARVAEKFGWEALGPEGFPDQGRRPEGISVELRLRRRDEDTEIWHRLQVGPITPGEEEGADLTYSGGQSHHGVVPTSEEAGKPMTTNRNETDRERADEAIRLRRVRGDDQAGRGTSPARSKRSRPAGRWRADG